MTDLRECSGCRTTHLPPAGRRCYRRWEVNMAEAEDNFQASNSFIPDSVIQQTAQQVDVDTLGASQPPGNQLAAKQPVGNHDTGTLLNTLQDFVGKFTQFQQQAEIDRNRVDLLLKQFEANSNTVSRKPKTPKRGAVKSNINIDNDQTCALVNSGVLASMDSDV